MKTDRIIFIVLFLLIAEFLFSQDPVGLKFDINGMPFNGYFDPFTYSPEKELWIVHNSDSYEIGHYYDNHNIKFSGLIMFENKKIWFGKNKDSEKKKIKPDEINSFVIGVDSFFVAKNFQYKGKMKTKPEFVQYVTEIYGDVFAKYYHFTSELGMYVTSPSLIYESYLVKTKDSEIWEEFPDDIRFKKTALKFFGYIPYLKDKIIFGDYTRDDILSMIKISEYFEKYQNNELIYFDRFWQEVRNPGKAKYHARITDFDDTRWTFLYFRDSTKLYKVDYTSFFPNTKDGEFISYYPNGNEREIILYKEDLPEKVWIFDESGKMKYQYQFLETKKRPDLEGETHIIYSTIFDESGNNLIDESTNFEHEVYDPFSDISYVQKYSDDELVTSYRLMDQDTVFQITDPTYDFKVKAMQKKLNGYMSEKTYDEALSVDAQGRILVSFVINDKGYVVDYVVLNSIHAQLDGLVRSFIRERLVEGAEFRHKFKAYKKDKKKRFCEVVIAFNFTTNRFYREVNNYYYNNFWEMNMMNQQLLQQYNMPPPMHVPTGF